MFRNLKLLRSALSEKEQNNFKIVCLNDKIKINEKILEKYTNDPEISTLITENFKASKTAKNGLSLFSKDEEKNLKSKEQAKDIENFFEITAMLLNKKIPENEIEENYVKTFFKKIIPPNMELSNINNFKF